MSEDSLEDLRDQINRLNPMKGQRKAMDYLNVTGTEKTDSDGSTGPTGGSDIAIYSPEDSDFLKALERAAKTPMPTRRETVQDDRFGILEVEDKFEILIAKMFDACEYMTMEQLHVKSNKSLRRSYRRNEMLIFRTVKFDHFRKYYLTRSQDGGDTTYHFKRDGKESGGFYLIRRTDGDIILRTNEVFGATGPKEDQEYWEDISTSKTLLDKYFEEIGTSTSKAYSDDAVVKLKGWLFPEPTPRQKALIRRHRMKVGIAIPLLLIAPMIGDNIVNGDDHYRQDFDAKGLHLSAAAPTILSNGETVKFTMASIDRDIAESAPIIDLGSSEVQSLTGPRRINLEGGFYQKGECTTSYVDIGKAQGIRAVTDSSAWTNLRATLSPNADDNGIHQLEICSTADTFEAPDIINHIVVEPVA